MGQSGKLELNKLLKGNLSIGLDEGILPGLSWTEESRFLSVTKSVLIFFKGVKFNPKNWQEVICRKNLLSQKKFQIKIWSNKEFFFTF